MKEISKDIKGYEGLYQISNLGNIKRLEHKKYNKNQILKEMLLKPKSANNGYVRITLRKNNCRARKIIQKDMDGNIIKEWDYMTEITEKLGYDYTDISKCCSGKYKSSKGFIWEYKE